jgi:hypothetical protein
MKLANSDLATAPYYCPPKREPRVSLNLRYLREFRPADLETNGVHIVPCVEWPEYGEHGFLMNSLPLTVEVYADIPFSLEPYTDGVFRDYFYQEEPTLSLKEKNEAMQYWYDTWSTDDEEVSLVAQLKQLKGFLENLGSGKSRVGSPCTREHRRDILELIDQLIEHEEFANKHIHISPLSPRSRTIQIKQMQESSHACSSTFGSDLEDHMDLLIRQLEAHMVDRFPVASLEAATVNIVLELLQSVKLEIALERSFSSTMDDPLMLIETMPVSDRFQGCCPDTRTRYCWTPTQSTGESKTDHLVEGVTSTMTEGDIIDITEGDKPYSPVSTKVEKKTRNNAADINSKVKGKLKPRSPLFKVRGNGKRKDR